MVAMEERKVERNSLEEYLLTTTAHGLRRFTDENSTKRRLWFLAMSALGVVTIYLLVEIVLKLSYPVVSTNIRNEIKQEIKFPAITICNQNKIRLSKVLNDPKMLYINREWLSPYLSQSDLDILFEDANVSPQAPSGNDNVTELLKSASHLNLIYEAMRSDTLEDVTDNFTLVLTSMGVCHQYVPPDNHVVRQAGSYDGLHILLNVEHDEYFIQTDDWGQGSVGIKLMVHDPHDVPRMLEEGLSVAIGTHANVGIKQEVQRYMNTFEHECWDPKSPDFKSPLVHYPNYSRALCVTECMMNYTSAECGCKAFYQPGQAPVCVTYDTLRCHTWRRTNFSLPGKGGYERCNCPTECEKTNYITSLTIAKYPSDYHVQFYKKLVPNSTINMHDQVQLNVYYQTMDQNTIEQIPSYTLRNVWGESCCTGDLGGCLGLCLGASLVTLLELIEFCLSSLSSRLKTHSVGQRQ